MAPSLLSADFGRLAEGVAAIEAAGAEVLHLDVMDGHFVPNISFGIPVIKSLRPKSSLFFDTHLMIEEPARYAKPFVDAGADLVTFHIEVTSNPKEVCDVIRSAGAFAGVSLNPTTPIDSILPILTSVDLVLVMSVWPGFGGQSFISDVLEKLERLRDLLRPDQRLQIDGGIGPATISAAVNAGADTLVAGSAIFGREDPVGAMRELQKLAEQAATKRQRS